MTLTTDKVPCGVDLSYLLLSGAGEATGCHRNQPWAAFHHTLSPEGSTTEDLLDALLGGSDSSATTSPLWSPCTTDSSINEEPLTDHTALPAFHEHSFPPPPPVDYHDKTPYVSIDLGWESGEFQEQFGITYCLTKTQTSPLSSNQTLTVKDLLLSNLGGRQQTPQHSRHELVLSEDEKKLLAKEGVKLPSKLPLSKLEERTLKKIRRKIRNKRSAQESRKKRREYVDILEGRMSACSANNLELQRKIQQLEETNTALLEQLSRLQALLTHGSSRTTHRGTCILVLLLSFSLLISSNLQPEPYSQLSQAEFTRTKVPSRSLQSADDAQISSLSLLSIFRGPADGKAPTDLPTVDFLASSSRASAASR